jgi:hypothetical protein
MTVASAGPRGLDAGQVVRSTFRVLARDWPAFLALGVLLSLAPRLLARWVVFQPAVLGLGDGSLIGRALLSGALTLAIEILPAALLIGVIAARATSGLGRQERTLAACVAAALRRAPVLAAASLLLNLGVTAGLVLLVVPGALLMLAWCVALPAAAVERGPVASAFRRSADLTRGHRKTILMLLLAAGFVAAMLALAFGIGLGLMAIPLRAVSPQWLLHGDPGVVLGGAVGGTLSAVLFAAGGSALYHELRQLKDSGGAGDLAAVFD